MADISIGGCISNHLIYTYIVNKTALPEYIAILLRSSQVKDGLKDLVTDQKAKAMLKRDILESIVVKLPKIDMQQAIIDKILNKSKEVSLNEISMEKRRFENKLL